MTLSSSSVPRSLRLGRMIGLAMFALSVAACGGSDRGNASSSEAGPAARGAFTPPEIAPYDITAHLDTTVSPGTDFYRYANGAWLDAADIPPEYDSFGTFTRLLEEARRDVKDVIEASAATSAPAGTIERQVGDYYAAMMNESAIDRAGLAPLHTDFLAIAAAASLNEVLVFQADPARLTSRLLTFSVDVDDREPRRHAVYASVGGLGASSRDVYLSPAFEAERAAYQRSIFALLQLADAELSQIEGREGASSDDLLARAAALFALEAKLAAVLPDAGQRRQPDLNYAAMTRDQLKRFAPSFPWTDMLAAAGLDVADRIVLRAAGPTREMWAILEEAELTTLHDHLLVHSLRNHAEVLPRAVRNAVLLAVPPSERRVTRWRVSVEAVINAIPDAVGQLYVRTFVHPDTKEKATLIADAVRNAFAARIERATWMENTTRALALDKLGGIAVKVAYPHSWADYSGLEIDPQDPVGNLKRAIAFRHALGAERLGQPVDRGIWKTPAFAVNAYYAPDQNEIILPAGMLRAPLFDVRGSPAANFGALGGIVGHELVHAVDERGRLSDAEGLAQPWWSKADEEAYFEMIAGVDALLLEAAATLDVPLSPARTRSEAIGDLGGLGAAFDAFSTVISADNVPDASGLSAEQQFFVGWARVWQRKYRNDAARRRARTQPYPPSVYRTNGTVRHIDAWYDAFDISEEDPLFVPPEARVRIW